MQELVFVNGPIQNGDFTFRQRPGKATGIRLAAALNQLLGNRPVPHLFNTVTLAGDLRHRAAQAGEAVSREAFEAALIAAKYDDGQLPHAWAGTDTDPDVAGLALEMTEALLHCGTLNVNSERVPCCMGCGHMAGPGSQACKACGGSGLRPRALRLLIADRPPGIPALDFADVHAHRRRAPLHLRNIADNAPERLLLARTRAHGISLEPLGMRGLVLDPRAGLHITALAAARAHGAASAVMLLTDNALANVAAYGQPFLQHDGVRLRYGLHGHVPYDALSGLAGAYERYRFTPAVRTAFETWFLPLYSWHAKGGIPASQLPELLKHFHRARLAAPEPSGETVQRLRDGVRAGFTDWLTRKADLAAGLPR